MKKELNFEETAEKATNVFVAWGKRTPRFETHYEDDVIRVVNTYGRGFDKYTEDKGKVLGAAYEMLILAFFIGLYSDKRIPLPTDTNEVKVCGQPIQFWGNNDRFPRQPYPRIRDYMFVALVAKADIDWIALEKGELEISEVVTVLIHLMEEYINYGFSVIYSKIEIDKSYFYDNKAFINMFLDFAKHDKTLDESNDEAPDSLD